MAHGNIVAELARQTVEEYYNEDHYEALEAFAVEEECGFTATPEQEQAARDAACYGQDDTVLCIDTTEGGQVIPESAFY